MTMGPRRGSPDVLFINLYTRFFELFWNSPHKTIFFALLGISFWIWAAKPSRSGISVGGTPRNRFTRSRRERRCLPLLSTFSHPGFCHAGADLNRTTTACFDTFLHLCGTFFPVVLSFHFTTRHSINDLKLLVELPMYDSFHRPDRAGSMRAIVALYLILAACAGLDRKDTLPTVSSVDLARYAGI